MTTIQDQLQALAGRQLIQRLLEEEDAYAFRHVLTQETVQESLLHKTRAALHRRVAAAYEALYPDRLEEYAPLLARHYAEGGDDARTVVHASRAGDAAARVFANAEAVALYSLALAAAKRAGAGHGTFSHLYTARGRALELGNRYPEALESYADMEEFGRQRQDDELVLESLILRSTIRAIPSPVFDAAEAQKLSDRGLALARELGDRPAEARIFWNLLILNAFSNHTTEAVDYGERSLAICREFGLDEQMALTANDLGRVYLASGQVDKAAGLLEQAGILFQRSGNLPMLADNLAIQAILLTVRGDYDRSLEKAEEGLAVSRKIGNLWQQFTHQQRQVEVLAGRGEFGRVLELLQKNVDIAEQIKNYPFLGMALATQAWIYGLLGAFDRGRASARAALEAIQHPAAGFHRAQVLSSVARFYLLDGDIPAARQAVREIPVDPGQAMMTPGGVWQAILDREFALAENDYARALESLDEWMERVSSSGNHLYTPDTLYLKARGLAGLGRREEAIQALQQARAEAQARGARRILVPVLALLTRLLEEESETAQAEQAAAEGKSVALFIADHAPADCRPSFLARPDVRALVGP